jgi:hypothetical protein
MFVVFLQEEVKQLQQEACNAEAEVNGLGTNKFNQ